MVDVLAQASIAQSHPAWWTWAHRDANTIVGLRLDALRGSTAASSTMVALFSRERLALPELDCLKQSQAILISAPPVQVAFSGGCLAAQLAEQGAARGLRRSVFLETEMWSAPTGFALAHLGGKLVVAGGRKSIEQALEDAQSEGGRKYSTLLAQAAQYKDEPLWIVASGRVAPALAVFQQIEAGMVLPDEPERVTDNRPAPAAPRAPTVAAVQQPSPPLPAKRVVRIVGLDGGDREIELPRAASQ